MKKINLSILLTLFFVLVMGAAIYFALDFPFLGAIYPIVVASFVLILALYSLVQQVKVSGSEEGLAESKNMGAIDIEAESSMPMSERFQKATRAFAWLLALYLLIWLVGFKIGAIVFIIVYIRIMAGTRWVMLLSLTVGLVFFLFCFDWLLGVYWPVGLLGLWLEDTWPWLF
jgi:hypothetical protein